MNENNVFSTLKTLKGLFILKYMLQWQQNLPFLAIKSQWLFFNVNSVEKVIKTGHMYTKHNSY